MILKTTSAGINIFIRSETKVEHDLINKLIYTAFTNTYGAKTGTDMIEQFKSERVKDTFIQNFLWWIYYKTEN